MKKKRALNFDRHAAFDPSVVRSKPLYPVCVGRTEDRPALNTNAVEAGFESVVPATAVATETVAPVKSCVPA